jgi:bifunctional isochorismate lyase/aryl carrier protein
MKTPYFTIENIDIEAKNLINKAIKDIKTKKTSFCIENSALLVLDMQKFFVDDSSHACIPSAKAIIPNINMLISLFKNKNRPVIITKHVNTNENAGLMGTWWKDTLTEENPDSRIIDDINISDGIIIEKTQYDAFYGTELENILKEKNIKCVLITGVMAHLCCETTARSAFIRGFEPFFVVDATATYNENFHVSTILNLAHGFALPVLTSDIEEQICIRQ